MQVPYEVNWKIDYLLEKLIANNLLRGFESSTLQIGESIIELSYNQVLRDSAKP